jgi:hypothetical protein
MDRRGARADQAALLDLVVVQALLDGGDTDRDARTALMGRASAHVTHVSDVVTLSMLAHVCTRTGNDTHATAVLQRMWESSEANAS